jgi:hypothetical protein
MATLLEQQRLRLDLGLAADDEDGLSDATIDALFVEVEETYTDSSSIIAATRVTYISRLMMQAAADVDYTQNNTQEKSSQRYAHLAKELAKWQARLDAAVEISNGSAARFGRTTRRPARIKEHPGGNGWSTWWPT